MNHNKKSDEDLYNVKTYSDAELIDMLDLNNPTDRELEAKIIYLINKYENMQNHSGDQLSQFFKDMYAHLFDIDEIVVEDNINLEIDGELNITEGMETMASSSTQSSNTPTSNISSAITTNVTVDSTKLSTSNNDNNILLTKTLDVAKDNMNPLLQQTIKRTISIDSQYRNDKKTLSTDFTFILSEPLRDVVSLKLYAVQIPYTWYTINNDFGSNYFYLKGVTPGINDGNYDYKIDISSGNYLPGELATSINKSFARTAGQYTDVSFGNTNVLYNPNTLLLSTTIDINSTYNETDYYLDFYGAWSTPNDSNIRTTGVNSSRFQTIPGFLGYNYKTYYPYTINSSATLPLSNASIANDTAARIYYMDGASNKITIIKYIGPDEYDELTSIIDLSFQIILPITRADNLYTRRELLTSLNNQITSNSYLSSESSIQRIDITDTSLINVGQSFFQLKIKPNRFKTNNFSNSKMAIQFPSEINILTNTNKIWTGTTSCFQFKYSFNELNNIIAETPPVAQQGNTYLIGSSNANPPYIKLRSISKNFETYKNNVSINMAVSSIIGYTQTEYINAINNGIINTSKQSPEITAETTIAYIDSKTSIFNYQFDINKTFNQSYYVLDLSNVTGLRILGLSGTYDLLQSNIISSQFSIASSYTLNGDSLAIMTASSEYISTSEQYIINCPDTIFYTTYIELQNSINKQFQTYITSGGQNILSGTNVSLNLNAIDKNIIDCSLTVSIQRTLTETDYSVQFVDPSSFIHVVPVTNECAIDLSASILHKFIGLSATLDLSGQSTFTSYFSPYTITGEKLAIIYPRSYQFQISDKTSKYVSNNTLLVGYITGLYDNLNSLVHSISDVSANFNIAYKTTGAYDYSKLQLVISINNSDLNNYTISIPTNSLFAILFNISGENLQISPSYSCDATRFQSNNTYIEYTLQTTNFFTIQPKKDIFLTIDVPSNPYNQDIYSLSKSINNQFLYSSNKIGNFTYSLSETNINLYLNTNGSVDCSFTLHIKTGNNVDVTSMYIVDLSNSKSYLHNGMNISSNQSNISSKILDLNANSHYSSSFPQYFNKYNIVGTNVARIMHSFDSTNMQKNPYIFNINDYDISYSNQMLYDISISIIETNYSNLSGLQSIINTSISNFKDLHQINDISGNINFITDTSGIYTGRTTSIFDIYKITQYDPTRYIVDTSQSSWYKYLNIDEMQIQSIYRLSNALIGNKSYADVSGTNAVIQNIFKLTSANNYFYLKPYSNGVTAPNAYNDIKITIPLSTNISSNNYTRNNLLVAINNALLDPSLNANLNANTKIISGTKSPFSIITTSVGLEQTIFRPTITTSYTAKDYNIVYYDPYSFVKCFVGATGVRNTTWDATLGWVLGYRSSVIYSLSDYANETGTVTIMGDTAVCSNLFNSFMICLDDYNQNRLNDGLVTITTKDYDIPLPSYADRTQLQIDPVNGTIIYNPLSTPTTDPNSNLTQNQMYSISQIANSRTTQSQVVTSNGTTINSKSYGQVPFIKDIFGLIPMKVAGLANGASYTEFGGTLQNQDRLYFGPVNIYKMSVQLINDRGNIVDLNGANWSFSLICEQLYKQKLDKK